MKRYWFKAKQYGWGWYPATWHGWVVFLVYLTLFFGAFVHADRYSHSGSDTLYAFIPQALVLTVILLVICYFTGERLGWRWGS